MGAQGLLAEPALLRRVRTHLPLAAGVLSQTASCATHATVQSPIAAPEVSHASGFPILQRHPLRLDLTGTINSMNHNFKQGMVQQFNVNVEHQLPGQVLLTVGYAGSRASHILVYGNNLNV